MKYIIQKISSLYPKEKIQIERSISIQNPLIQTSQKQSLSKCYPNLIQISLMKIIISSLKNIPLEINWIKAVARKSLSKFYPNLILTRPFGSV